MVETTIIEEKFEHPRVLDYEEAPEDSDVDYFIDFDGSEANAEALFEPEFDVVMSLNTADQPHRIVDLRVNEWNIDNEE